MGKPDTTGTYQPGPVLRAIIRRLTASFFALTLLTAPQLASAGPVYSFGGHSYFLTNGLSSWTGAQVQAVSLGGNLVTINDVAEQNFLVSTFLSGADATTKSYWIGINDQASEGVFVWASGEPVTYTNWEVGEPNNYVNAFAVNGEDFGVINWTPAQENRGSVGSWNDVPDIGINGSLNGPLPLLGIVEVAPSAVPEIDPAGMGSVLALVTGGLGLLERRRLKVA